MAKPRVKKATDVQWTECTVLDAVESQYEGTDKGIFLRGVRDATGYGQSRTADGLYMGCWQSVGIQLHGFEVKVSRGDWLKEIQDVSKAGCFEKYCHYWWVCVTDGIVELAEMPAQWGLKIVSKTEDGERSCRVKKAATLNSNASLDYKFFASCLRKCKREDPGEIELKKKMDAEYWRGKKDGEKSNRSHQSLERVRDEVEKHQKKLADFETASGVRIEDWHHNPRQIGEAVRHVLQYGIGHAKRLQEIVSLCDRIRDDTNKLIELEKESASAAPTEAENPDEFIAELVDKLRRCR